MLSILMIGPHAEGSVNHTKLVYFHTQLVSVFSSVSQPSYYPLTYQRPSTLSGIVQ